LKHIFARSWSIVAIGDFGSICASDFGVICASDFGSNCAIL
jgi:hypothetical protein